MKENDMWYNICNIIIWYKITWIYSHRDNVMKIKKCTRAISLINFCWRLERKSSLNVNLHWTLSKKLYGWKCIIQFRCPTIKITRLCFNILINVDSIYAQHLNWNTSSWKILTQMLEVNLPITPGTSSFKYRLKSRNYR